MNAADHRMSTQPGYVLVERPQDYVVVPSELPAVLQAIAAYCESVGCRKVLLVGPGTRVKLTTADIYDLGKEIAALRLKLAVVESHDASSEGVELLENVASNRGGSIQFFDDELSLSR